MIILWMAKAARAQAQDMKPEYPLAAESRGLFGSDPRAGDGAKSEMTFMASFIPLEQWSETPQAYHFLPGPVRVITSFPLVEAGVSGIAHAWKSAALLSLWTS